MSLIVRLEVLERFLKGEVSPRDLITIKCTIVDQLLVMYAIAIARPGQYFQPDEPAVLAMSIGKLYCAVYRTTTKSAAQTSRLAGLHVSTNRGAAPVRLTLPREAMELIERHKDNPHGGIAKFFGGRTQSTGVMSAEVLAAVAINRLRSVYGPEVLKIIKATL